MFTPGAEWTMSAFVFFIEEISVGVNVWNAMSMLPCWRSSFIVDDFE